MIKKSKQIKIFVLEKHKKTNSYLIERKYKKTLVIEYIVCTNYDFNSNTYEKGVIYNDIEKGYHAFTSLVCDSERYYELALGKNLANNN